MSKPARDTIEQIARARRVDNVQALASACQALKPNSSKVRVYDASVAHVRPKGKSLVNGINVTFTDDGGMTVYVKDGPYIDRHIFRPDGHHTTTTHRRKSME